MQITYDRIPYNLRQYFRPTSYHGCEECYVCKTVAWAREVRRVLQGDGVMFLVLGDSYANDTKWGGTTGGKHAAGLHGEPIGRARRDSGLKGKDLVGIPWRVALALQADGWWLRSDVIWAKPNPMPESVTDRPTKSHEYVFILAKSQRYYWDQEAVKEEPAGYERKGGTAPYTANGSTTHGIGSNSFHQMATNGRNMWSVWNIATQPYAGAHFAVFPEKLIEPMVKAATSERGCCPKCGKAWERVVKKAITNREGWGPSNPNHATPQGTHGPSVRGEGRCGDSISTTLGWQPVCACDAGDPIPCTILDPFGGSGTVASVALRLGRRAILCELNPEYIELQKERVGTTQPLLEGMAL